MKKYKVEIGTKNLWNSAFWLELHIWAFDEESAKKKALRFASKQAPIAYAPKEELEFKTLEVIETL